MHSHLIQNDTLLFGFYIFPWTNKPNFCFVLFLTLVTQHDKLSLLDRGNIYNFSLLFRENKWGSHGLSNATKLARQIQEIGEIWEGFSQWQLDFGSSCGFTTAAAERKPHIERPRDLHAPSWKSFIRFCPSFTVFYGFFLC